jgi:hypothetical protein
METIYTLFAKENEPMKDEKHWYITVIAALYLLLCSISLVRYAVIDFRSDTGTVPVTVQLLCLGVALAAGAYFVKPRVGHKGLILFTIGTLVAIGTTDPKATCFHLVILCLLMLPNIRGRARMGGNSEPDASPNGGHATLSDNAGATKGPSSLSFALSVKAYGEQQHEMSKMLL